MKGTFLAMGIGALLLLPLIAAGGGYWVSIGYILGGLMAILQMHLMEKLDK
ncbi:hypothetical protein [Vibrio phage PJN101]|nr:hypothetical protein [Vibrio phage PJN101]